MRQRHPLPLPSSPSVTLNRSEWVYAACDGAMGQLNQAYILRFDAPLGAPQAKAALRRLLVAFPRLRAVLEPTARRFRLRVLPDDDTLDILVDAAFQEDHVDVDDPQALQRWHERALNEPVSLQRGLGVRLLYAAHPTRGALLWSVHHLLCDGRSMMMTLDALVQLLNGLPIADQPLEDPSMLPAVLPPRWWQWPGRFLAAWHEERDHQRELARHDIVRLPHRRLSRYLTTGVQHHDLGCTVKALSQAAKARGGSGNSMLMAAAATALLELAGNRAGTAALVRMSVDLRRYFPDGRGPGMGNYVATLDIPLPVNVPEAERVAWMDTRVRQGLERFRQRSMVLPLIPYEWLGWISTHGYNRLLRRAKRLDMLPMLSCHATNIGSADAFGGPPGGISLQEIYPTVSGAAPLLVFVAVAGRQLMTASHQRDEYRGEDVQAMARRMKQILDRWMPTAPAA